MHLLRLFLFTLLFVGLVRAEDGYRLWLRYDRIEDNALRSAYTAATATLELATPSGRDSPTIAAARRELTDGLGGLLGVAPQISLIAAPAPAALAGNAEGYTVRREGNRLRVAAGGDTGLLYGVFALLREIQQRTPVERLELTSAPRIARRLLNHWDNLNRTIERGYAGFSLWEWPVLPDYVSPRYRDYARACASIGLNGTVLTNVNADALILTPDWLRKVNAIAGVLRPYGVRVYLTARFSAPMELGKLKTADPLDPAVIAWWRAKIAEIYAAIPDFGGFLVKANSEGQPGPQTYGRTHADGANLLADAVAPHGGIVLWRAFVYEAHIKEDRIKQAYTEFKPLDGKFRDNVVVQIKNGPFDFQPREPFHPLFGGLRETSVALEVQITQEYLGQGAHVAFLAPMWREVLSADTYARGPGTTVAQILEGKVTGRRLTAIAGVANTGTDRNWTGHPLAQANWYAYGRLAWDPTLDSATIAREWVGQTFGPATTVATTLVPLLLESHETVVNYTDPLGLTGIFAKDHHYGPEPWLADGRPDWTSVYYHRADRQGVGFDRTATGSNALAQYSPEVARLWSDPATCPENLLLWFHRLPWDHRLRSGDTLWDGICRHYQAGVDTVRRWQKEWEGLRGAIDEGRHGHVRSLLVIQERDARWWRDACLLYFQTFSQRPLPAGVEPPEHDLAHYRAIKLRWMPGNPSGK